MKLPRMILTLAGLMVGLAVVAGACGSDDNKTATSTSGAASSSSPARAGTAASGAGAPTTPAGGATTAAGGGLNVTAQDFSFTPDTLKATKGSTITINFSNQGSATHTLTLYTDENFTKKLASGDTDRVSAGGSKTISVPIPSDSGDLYFRCEVHPSLMKGEVSVD